MVEPLDGEADESRWQANERRLTEIAAMTGLGREMHAAESESLRRRRTRSSSSWARTVAPGSRRWSGTP
jgi:hypothetical protein